MYNISTPATAPLRGTGTDSASGYTEAGVQIAI